MNLTSINAESDFPDSIIGIKDGHPVRVPVGRDRNGQQPSVALAELTSVNPPTMLAAGVEYRVPPASHAQALAQAGRLPSTSDDFLSSALRGQHTDEVFANDPRSQQYVDLFARSRSNITRRFLGPVSSGAVGTPYSLPAGVFQTLRTDLARFAAIGCRTVICLSPKGPAGRDDATQSAFWADTVAGAAARASHVEACRAFAAEFAGDERIAAISVLNEPIDGTAPTSSAKTEQFLQHQEACFDAIRSADPARTCMVTCGWSGQPGGYTQMRLVRQPNVVYEFHFYQPYEITHANVSGQQAYAGLYPSALPLQIETGSGYDSNLTSPAIADIDRMRQIDMRAPIEFKKRYGVPMFVGEFTCGVMTRQSVATNWIEDAIKVFEENGMSWCQFGFWFPGNPWACFEIPSSSQLISFNNGTTSGTAALNTFTGGAISGRTPFAVVTKYTERNSLYRTAAVEPFAPSLLLTENFEATPGRLATAYAVDAGTTRVLNSTAAPKSGAQHARFTHVSGAGPANSSVNLGDNGTGRTYKQYTFEADICVRQAITSGSVLALLDWNTFGIGSGAYIRLINVTGQNLWQIEVWRGSGDYGSRPFFRADGLTFPAGVYRRVRITWQQGVTNGRIRLWMDDAPLIDINGIPTVTTTADYLWNPIYGLLLSNQPGQIVDFDNVRFSGGDIPGTF